MRCTEKDGFEGKQEELSGANQSTVGSEQLMPPKVHGTRGRTFEATLPLRAVDEVGKTPVQTRKPRTQAARNPIRTTRVQTNMHAYMHPNANSMPNTATKRCTASKQENNSHYGMWR
eukprot:gene8288-17049_t